MKERLLITALHVGELLVAFGLAFAAMKLLKLDLPPEVGAALLAALLKFIRTGGNDYVNAK